MSNNMTLSADSDLSLLLMMKNKCLFMFLQICFSLIGFDFLTKSYVVTNT